MNTTRPSRRLANRLKSIVAVGAAVTGATYIATNQQPAKPPIITSPADTQPPWPKVTVGPVERRAPQHDSLLLLKAAEAVGDLTYISGVPTSDPQKWTPYLTTATLTGTREAVVVTRPVYTNSEFFSSQDSPDGRTMLLKVGQCCDTGSSYRILLLDLASGTIARGPKFNLSFPTVLWSPDSRYFSFVTGGDSSGAETQWTDQMRLYIYDTQTASSHFIVADPTVKYISWTSRNTILYSAVAHAFPQKASPGNKKHATVQGAVLSGERPDLFEFTPATGTCDVLLTNAFRPVPSEDGRFILIAMRAPTGEPAAEDLFSIDDPPKASLALCDMATKTRRTIRREHDIWTEALWSPTSDCIVMINPSEDAESEFLATIEEISPKTLAVKKVSELRTQGANSFGEQSEMSAFKLIAFSENAKKLYLRGEYVGPFDKATGSSPCISKLLAVDMANGRQTVLFKSDGLDINWRPF